METIFHFPTFWHTFLTIRHNFATLLVPSGVRWDRFWCQCVTRGAHFKKKMNRWGLKGEHQTTSKAQLTTNCAYPDVLTNPGIHFLTHFRRITDIYLFKLSDFLFYKKRIVFGPLLNLFMELLVVGRFVDFVFTFLLTLRSILNLLMT